MPNLILSIFWKPSEELRQILGWMISAHTRYLYSYRFFCNWYQIGSFSKELPRYCLLIWLIWISWAGGIAQGVAFPVNLRQWGNALALWLGISPSDLFLYIFLPPMLLDAAIRISYFHFRKVKVPFPCNFHFRKAIFSIHMWHVRLMYWNLSGFYSLLFEDLSAIHSLPFTTCFWTQRDYSPYKTAQSHRIKIMSSYFLPKSFLYAQ